MFEEPIEAWEFGPVVPSVYHEFKHFGKNHINCFSVELAGDFNDEASLKPFKPFVPQTDTKTIDILNIVWDTYQKFSANALVNITHKKGTPWAGRANVKHSSRSPAIPNEAIKNYYKKFISDTIGDPSFL